MIKNLRKSIPLVLLAVFFLSASAGAQSVDFSSTPNPVGSGARATGMGGAFIGVADDATAASWNPAGLIQLEKPEVSFVYANFSREQTYHSSSHPEINTTNTMSENAINYLSAVFKPFVLFDHNVVLSINYQRLYEMGKNISFRYNLGSNPGDVSFKQNGYLYALSPAAAVQVTPTLSVGVTLNFWKDYLGANGWDQTTHFNYPTISFESTKRKTVSFDGINTNLGILWNATPEIALGGVVKTPFDAKLDEITMTTVLNGATPTEATYAQTHSTMSMPLSYGIGVQYRPTDTMTFALDAYSTDWSSCEITTADGQKKNPFDGKPISEGKLKDTMQVRFGAEYLIIGNDRTIALRGGLFSDPAPSKGKTDNYYGFSLGTGYATKKYSLDASYQMRQGNDVQGDIAGIPDNKTDVTQQTIMASVIWYF